MKAAPKTLGIGSVGLAVAGLVALMAWGMLNQDPATGRSGFTRVHKPAPEFTLPLFGGGEFRLRDHRGQPVVVNFWASWCPPCREEAPALERTWKAYKDEGVMFVGVDLQDTEEHARAFIQEFGLTYPNGPDNQGRITVDYGVVGLPVTFFVDRNGVIVRRFVGALSEEQLVMWTGQLLAGEALEGGPGESNPGEYFELDERSSRR